MFKKISVFVLVGVLFALLTGCNMGPVGVNSASEDQISIVGTVINSYMSAATAQITYPNLRVEIYNGSGTVRNVSSSLNVRYSPDLNSSKIGYMYPNEKCTVLAYAYHYPAVSMYIGYYLVEYKVSGTVNTKRGWVCNDFLSVQ